MEQVSQISQEIEVIGATSKTASPSATATSGASATPSASSDSDSDSESSSSDSDSSTTTSSEDSDDDKKTTEASDASATSMSVTNSSSDTWSSISTSIDPRLPAGGISMITPASTATTYVKIGQAATFEWTYTSLSVTPHYLNIEAYCSLNSQTYTLTTNQLATETSFVFDTKEYQANQTVDFVTSEYTLYIYDSSRTVSDVASAGYLSSLQFAFGMYRPQSYTPWAKDGTYINMSPETPIVAKWMVALIAITTVSALQVMLK